MQINNKLIKNTLNDWNGLKTTLTYSSWDSTVFSGVISTSIDLTDVLSVGQKIRFKQGTSLKYGFLTKITNNELTIFFGTEYILTNETITDIFYSTTKTPTGFPMNPDKWTIKYESSKVTGITNPVKDRWYNLATLNLPIGIWNVTYNAVVATTASGTATNRCYISIGTVSASQGSAGCMTGMNAGTTDGLSVGPATNNKIFNLTSPSTIYLTFMTSQPASFMNDIYANGCATTIRAVCAYL